MDLLLILTYTAICIVVFKVFKIPLNKWSVPTAVLGGIFLIGTLILLMNYNHPYSEMSRQYFVTTPIVPNVTGQVIEVPVKGNEPLNKGDLLFRLDPKPFQNKVNSLKARVRSAKSELDRIRQNYTRRKPVANVTSTWQLPILTIRALNWPRLNTISSKLMCALPPKAMSPRLY